MGKKYIYIYILLYLIGIILSFLTIKAVNNLEIIKAYIYLLVSFFFYFKAYSIQRKAK